MLPVLTEKERTGSGRPGPPGSDTVILISSECVTGKGCYADQDRASARAVRISAS